MNIALPSSGEPMHYTTTVNALSLYAPIVREKFAYARLARGCHALYTYVEKGREALPIEHESSSIHALDGASFYNAPQALIKARSLHVCACVNIVSADFSDLVE